MPSPAKKRFREDSEDEPSFRADKSMDCADDLDDYEDTDELCHGKEDLIQPRVMLEHVEGLFDEWFARRQNDSSSQLDQENVNEYLGRPESVLMHPDFPVKPPSLTTYYSKKFGCTAAFGKVKPKHKHIVMNRILLHYAPILYDIWPLFYFIVVELNYFGLQPCRRILHSVY
uniref:Enhancer of polycomb-like protein n=1 Tax=Angiostrongylus cantonensis TaxID=6313 RepID=A0A0K0DE18_ANGCA